MRPDQTITRASRQGIHTLPLPSGAPTAGQKIRHTPLAADDLADILDQARAQRITEDISAYAASRKRTA